MECAQGFALQGGTTVLTAGLSSSTYSHQSYPYATITVYFTGTTTLAPIYSNNNTPPTVMSNPFTANSAGRWVFYAPNGHYDVQIASPALTGGPWTITDMLLYDPYGMPNPPLSQTDQTANRAAGNVYRNTSSTMVLWVSTSWDCSAKPEGVTAYSGPNNPPVVLVGKILNPASGAQSGGTWQLIFPVLPGNYYRCVASGTPVLTVWMEYQ